MPEGKTQKWDFGEGLPDEGPAISNRELLNKTREATEAVGYRPPRAALKKESAPAPRPRGRPRKYRSIALSTKITAEQDALLKAISADGLVIADIVGQALTVFAADLLKTGRYKRIPLSDEALDRAKDVAGQQV